MTEPKLHHYLPRSYLRQFADKYDRITVRRRGAQPQTMNIKNAAAETHLYSIALPDGTKDTSAEKTLSSFEGSARRAMFMLRQGRIPRSGSPERQAFGLFLGLQMTRTPEQADRFMFAERAIEAMGGIDNVTTEAMRGYLRNHHLGFDPDEREVSGATDFVHGVNAMGLPTKSDLLQIMFENTIEVFGPLLTSMQWSIERYPKPILATCDRLPAMWHEYKPSEGYEGSGIMDAEELWFPLDPSALLVLRHRGSEHVTDVAPSRFSFVNAHLARHCYSAVFHQPASRDGSGEFTMADRRPSVRFSSGVLVDSLGTATNPLQRDIIHQWVPLRDDQ